MKWIEEKMKVLGITANQDYKISFYLDELAMISVHIDGRGLVKVKPLAVIWKKFLDRWSEANTIMFDDCSHNFLMNPQSGLKIKPFRQAHLNRDNDRELVYLKRYLRVIRREVDFCSLNHKKWKKYLKAASVKKSEPSNVAQMAASVGAVSPELEEISYDSDPEAGQSETQSEGPNQ